RDRQPGAELRVRVELMPIPPSCLGRGHGDIGRPTLIEEQVKAIANLKIDSVTVWDSGGKGKNGKNDTAEFVSGLVGALPPLHQLTRNVGIELPEFLGKLTDNPDEAARIIKKAKQVPPPEAPFEVVDDSTDDAPPETE
ncbi:MAG: hypothetical protein QGG01_06715, partial [Roseibacillus sp.]|nr:hypothetical protein [Roseibacillus sp.]